MRFTIEQNIFFCAKWSIISLLLVVIAGGVVRATGSGMGCPDWPKCFDCYIPPTNVTQLPTNYQEKYVSKRINKNKRLVRLLESIGYPTLAYQVKNDTSILLPEVFNPYKTWCEYVNRILGVIAGLFMLSTLLFSCFYFKYNKSVFLLASFNLILVLLQAWIGSVVVSTNLMPWMITIHMVLALALLAVAILIYFILSKSFCSVPSDVRLPVLMLIICLLITVYQIVIGTHVREEVDAVATHFKYLPRVNWLAKVGYSYVLHRVFALLVLLSAVWLYLRAERFQFGIIRNYVCWNFRLIFLQLMVGLFLASNALPPVLQILHLLIACVLFCVQFYLLLFSIGMYRLNSQNS